MLMGGGNPYAYGGGGGVDQRKLHMCSQHDSLQMIFERFSQARFGVFLSLLHDICGYGLTRRSMRLYPPPPPWHDMCVSQCRGLIACGAWYFTHACMTHQTPFPPCSLFRWEGWRASSYESRDTAVLSPPTPTPRLLTKSTTLSQLLPQTRQVKFQTLVCVDTEQRCTGVVAIGDLVAYFID